MTSGNDRRWGNGCKLKWGACHHAGVSHSTTGWKHLHNPLCRRGVDTIPETQRDVTMLRIYSGCSGFNKVDQTLHAVPHRWTVKPDRGPQARRLLLFASCIIFSGRNKLLMLALPLLPHSLEHKLLFYAKHLNFNIKSAAVQLNLMRGDVEMLSHGWNRRRAETGRGSFRSIH